MPSVGHWSVGRGCITKIAIFLAFLSVVAGVYWMPVLLHTARRLLGTMATEVTKKGTPYSIAYVTVGNKADATKLARGLVVGKLAACVNIIPGITSVYEWEGKVEEDAELLMMIKTKTSKVDELSKYIRENHPYDVAEVISTPIENGNPPYLEWLGNTVPDLTPPPEKIKKGE